MNLRLLYPCAKPQFTTSMGIFTDDGTGTSSGVLFTPQGSYCPILKFTVEEERHGILAFLDLEVVRQENDPKDGARNHTARMTMSFLSTAFPNHVISRNGDSDDIGSDTESCYLAMDPPGVVITDSVHRAIKLPKVCMDIIDTPEFQRLRAVKQCGICNLVYPSATHSRFEHSIGVCHWAREFLKHCGASISDDKKLCVVLAGLCHDLGHGPFSHMWERFLKACGIIWKHEANSAAIFRSLVAENNLEPIFKKYGLESEHVDFICRLIDGQVPKDEENVFLYEIIANKENGLDVDKFEYIMRDTKQFGMSYDVDIDRIINHVGIVEKDGIKYIGFRDKISDNLIDVFVYRAKLHRNCYQHHACKALELMLIDALLAADEHFRISWEETNSSGVGVEIRSCKLSECHIYPKAFLKATDCLFYDLLNSTSPELRESRMILEAMLKRDLYTLVFRKSLEPNPKHMDKMESDMVARLTTSFGSRYNCGFRSCFVKFSIGEGGDPLSKVKFFTKRSPSVPFNMSSNDIRSTSFIKENYHFAELLIFCTKGKKSMLGEEMDSVEAQAKSIYEELLAAGATNE